MATRHDLLDDSDFQELMRRKNWISGLLTGLTLLVYFGYMGLIAFHPATLSGSVGKVTMGIPLGIAVIVLAWIMTGLYVRWANSSYDAMVERVRAKHGGQQ